MVDHVEVETFSADFHNRHGELGEYLMLVGKPLADIIDDDVMVESGEGSGETTEGTTAVTTVTTNTPPADPDDTTNVIIYDCSFEQVGVRCTM